MQKQMQMGKRDSIFRWQRLEHQGVVLDFHSSNAGAGLWLQCRVALSAYAVPGENATRNMAKVRSISDCFHL